MTQSAKSGLLAFPNYHVSLSITPDEFNPALSYYTKLFFYVMGIRENNFRVIPNSQVKLWAVKYIQLKRL